MRKQKLIDAIRETIIDLQTGRREYDWSSGVSCNCGLLAQNLGASRTECCIGGFTRKIQECEKTGMQIPDVILRLKQAGLTSKQIEETEHLTNGEILNEAGIVFSFHVSLTGHRTHHKRGYKNAVLAYFQAWLRILERETPSGPKEEPAYKLIVTCSEKVKQLAKETVQLS